MKILPYQYNAVMGRSELNRIPDDVLVRMNKTELGQYVRGLYLISQPEQGYWTRGNEIMESLGFVRTSRTVGHREFVSLKYDA